MSLKVHIPMIFIIVLALRINSMAQVSYATIPCKIILEDSVLGEFFRFRPVAEMPERELTWLNEDSIGACIGRPYTVSMPGLSLQDEDVLHFFAPDRGNYLVHIDTNGVPTQICHSTIGTPPEDQFRIVTCLDKLLFQAPVKGGRKLKTFFFISISEPE